MVFMTLFLAGFSGGCVNGFFELHCKNSRNNQMVAYESEAFLGDSDHSFRPCGVVTNLLFNSTGRRDRPFDWC
jgi:hypothetical protein